MNSILKLDVDQIRQGLTWRQERGTLAIETAFLKVIREEMDKSVRYRSRMTANVDKVIEVSEQILKENKTKVAKLTPIQTQQAIIYAMIGPGFIFLPGFATTQPKDFYIDDRCGKPAFPRKAVYAAVKELVRWCEKAGVNPQKVPEAPGFHNCGVW